MKPFSRRGALLLGAFLAVLLFPRPSSAQVPFTAEAQYVSLLSSVTVQDVIGTPVFGFRMYATSITVNGAFAIVSATSALQGTFGLENGIRLSTGISPAVDSSSITACSVAYITTNTVDGLRMYYVGISNGGQYSILSATSTDGLTWSKEAGIRLQRNGGAAFLDSPHPMRYSPTITRLFYVGDSAGGNTPTNYRVYVASSSDQGLTFIDEGSPLPADQAYQVYATTLTDGRTRIYYSAPFPAPGTNLPGRVLSAISANGLVFQKEPGVRLSTDTQTSLTSLTYPVVVRSTETYRWRMFENYSPVGAGIPSFVSRALTMSPVPLTSSPSRVLTSQSNVPMSITGEIFSPGATANYVQGADIIPLTSVLVPNDLTMSGLTSPLNQSTGNYSLNLSNSDLIVGTLANALLIDIPPGALSLTDNLFRPLLGQVCTVAVQIFAVGQVTVRLYTMAGGLVTTLIDSTLPIGTTTTTWNGRTAQGNVVASGVYIVHATGPKLDDTQKIVVIK